jgi:hypothetical protein
MEGKVYDQSNYDWLKMMIYVVFVVTVRFNYSSSPERSPESGISTSHLSIPDADYADADAADEADFEETLPVLGKAKALYLFEGRSSNNFAVRIN